MIGDIITFAAILLILIIILSFIGIWAALKDVAPTLLKKGKE